MKRIFILLFLATIAFSAKAQDEEKVLEKPKDIKVHEFDEFKNSSFNIYEKSAHYKKMADGEEGLNAEDITGAKKLKNDVVTLNKKADALLEKAKNVKPRTKSPAAVKNIKKSVEALNEAKKNLEYVLKKVGEEE